MLVAAFLLSLLVGWLAGGRLQNLAGLSLRQVELIAAAFGIQVVLELAPLAGVTPSVWTGGAHILSYVLLVTALTVNIYLPGVWLLLGGTFLNGLVVAVNGGRMPVGPEVAVGDRPEMLAEDLRHQLLTDEMHLAALADIHAVHIFPEGPTGYSIGDLLLVAGIIWLVAKGMQAAPPRCEEESAVVK